MVRAGLDRINELQRPGLRFLARLAGLQAGPPDITVKDIAFRTDAISSIELERAADGQG